MSKIADGSNASSEGGKWQKQIPVLAKDAANAKSWMQSVGARLEGKGLDFMGYDGLNQHVPTAEAIGIDFEEQVKMQLDMIALAAQKGKLKTTFKAECDKVEAEIKKTASASAPTPAAEEIVFATYEQLMGKLSPTTRGLFQEKAWFVDPTTGKIESAERRSHRMQFWTSGFKQSLDDHHTTILAAVTPGDMAGAMERVTRKLTQLKRLTSYAVMQKLNLIAKEGLTIDQVFDAADDIQKEHRREFNKEIAEDYVKEAILLAVGKDPNRRYFNAVARWRIDNRMDGWDLDEIKRQFLIVEGVVHEETPALQEIEEGVMGLKAFTSTKASASDARPCRFGKTCRGASCPLEHPSGWDAYKNKKAHQRKIKESGEKGSSSANVACFECGGPHYKSECPTLKEGCAKAKIASGVSVRHEQEREDLKDQEGQGGQFVSWIRNIRYHQGTSDVASDDELHNRARSLMSWSDLRSASSVPVTRDYQPASSGPAARNYQPASSGPAAYELEPASSGPAATKLKPAYSVSAVHDLEVSEMGSASSGPAACDYQPASSGPAAFELESASSGPAAFELKPASSVSTVTDSDVGEEGKTNIIDADSARREGQDQDHRRRQRREGQDQDHRRRQRRERQDQDHRRRQRREGQDRDHRRRQRREGQDRGHHSSHRREEQDQDLRSRRRRGVQN